MQANRILTTHVGSLIRPPELVGYYKTMEQALAGGSAVDAAAFEACVTRSIADVVKQQAEVGIDLVSDGEFGKGWLWANYTIDRLSGLEHPRACAKGAAVLPDSRSGPARLRRILRRL